MAYRVLAPRKRPYYAGYSTPASVKRFKGAAASTSLRAFRASNKHFGTGVSRTGSLASQVKSLQRFVSTLKPEIKYHDTAAAGSNVTSSGTVDHVTNIATGDDVNTRTGNAINVVSITLKGTVVDFNTITRAHYRVAVVVDKQQVADTAPTAGSIFSDGVATANPVTAVPTIANLSRFNVLWMSRPFQSLVMANSNTNNYYEFTKKLNLKVSYNGTASTDIEKNGIYVVFLSDDSGNTVDFNGLCRIGFTDA